MTKCALEGALETTHAKETIRKSFRKIFDSRLKKTKYTNWSGS